MQRVLKTILSIEVMIILLILMALCSALATFIENDFGPLGARSFIYNQKWFELIFLVLSVGVIYHIIYSKMHKKFFTFIIHISLVLILTGSFLTRYFGFEATLTIPEGTMRNIAYSTDEYIQINLNNKEIDSQKMMITPLNTDSYNFQTKLNENDLKIELKNYFQNATSKLAPSENGKPTIDIFVSKFMGTQNIILKENETKDSAFVSFSFDKNHNTTKPTIFFELIEKQFYLNSNIPINIFTKDTKSSIILPKGEKIKVDTSLIYKIGQAQFKIKDALLKGELKTVAISKSTHKKEVNTNALVFHITYKNKTYEKTIFKKEDNQFPRTELITLGEDKLNLTWGSKKITLPFYIHLNDFELKRYPGSNSPSEYSSEVKVFDKNDNYTSSHIISMNNVLDYKGYRFFQSSYKKDESGTILSINKDPGKSLTYIGYFLLFAGLIYSLISKKGRFRKLASKKYNMENIKEQYYKKQALIKTLLIAVLLSTTIQNTYANEKAYNIDKNFSKELSKLLIQDYQGRIKPLDTLSRQILTKITKKSTINMLNSNQFFISATIYPEYWKEQKIFKIKSKRLKTILKIDPSENHIKFNDIFDSKGRYKLEPYLDSSSVIEASKRDKFDKELIKLDEKLNIIHTLFLGDFLRAFPLNEHDNNKWANLSEANNIYYNKEIVELTKNFYLSLIESSKTNNWETSYKQLEKIKEFQIENSALTLPNDLKIKSEVFFNEFSIFKKLVPFYLIVGFILLILTFINIIKHNFDLNKATKVSLYILILAFIIHTIGLALRWYIAGHAPWSNAYESMIYIAWTITLSGIYFSRQSRLALASTSILSGITLFVAHLNWLEPQITTLAPVLKSYWLNIHVSVITASYGFLALSALLGFITLILFIFINQKNEDDKFFGLLLGIKESNRISMMSIFIGLVLLVIGNFLGAIWANESWGRYWGWDPKETWTLVSIIVYTIIIHLKYVKNFMSEYLFAILSTVSYSAIIMTYFGVNYYLSGKHSYAAGDPIPIPDFIPISGLVFVVVCVLAYRNRKVI